MTFWQQLYRIEVKITAFLPILRGIFNIESGKSRSYLQAWKLPSKQLFSVQPHVIQLKVMDVCLSVNERNAKTSDISGIKTR